MCPPSFGDFLSKILETHFSLFTIAPHKRFASAHPGYDILRYTLYNTTGIYILYIIIGLLMLTMLVFLL